MPKRTYYTYRGQRMCMTAWARQYNMEPKTLHYRLAVLQWDIATALETPVQDHLLTPGITRWCPVHEVAWCQAPIHEPASYWRPLSRAMLAYALAYVRAFGCAGQITLVEAACDRCQEHNTYADTA